jgi:hypothetical protein
MVTPLLCRMETSSAAWRRMRVVPGAGDFRTKCAGNRADAAFDLRAICEKRGEQPRQPVRIRNPGVVAPVGAIDLFLHPLTVKRAIRKAVDRQHVVVAVAKKLAKRGERRRLFQRFGGLGR